MALVLVLSIGFDYAVSAARARLRGRPVTMLGVWLAMLTTLLSFGLLVLSNTYAVHAFGATLLVGTILAFAFSPIASDLGRVLDWMLSWPITLRFLLVLVTILFGLLRNPLRDGSRQHSDCTGAGIFDPNRT